MTTTRVVCGWHATCSFIPDMKNAKQKPFFAERTDVRPAQLHTPAFRKVRAALARFDRQGVKYTCTCESRRADAGDSTWNVHHVFVTVSEQDNLNHAPNTIGKLGASNFCASWHVVDSEPGCKFRSGSKFQFGHRMGWMTDLKFRSADKWTFNVLICCNAI